MFVHKWCKVHVCKADVYSADKLMLVHSLYKVHVFN